VQSELVKTDADEKVARFRKAVKLFANVDCKEASNDLDGRYWVDQDYASEGNISRKESER